MNFRGRGYFDRRNGEFSIGVDTRSKFCFEATCGFTFVTAR